jgi:hypothetical protein
VIELIPNFLLLRLALSILLKNNKKIKKGVIQQTKIDTLAPALIFSLIFSPNAIIATK